MLEGILWYSKEEPEAAVRECARLYRMRFEQEPNVCFVNNNHNTDIHEVDGIVLKRDTITMPHYYWVCRV